MADKGLMRRNNSVSRYQPQPPPDIIIEGTSRDVSNEHWNNAVLFEGREQPSGMVLPPVSLLLIEIVAIAIFVLIVAVAAMNVDWSHPFPTPDPWATRWITDILTGNWGR